MEGVWLRTAHLKWAGSEARVRRVVFLIIYPRILGFYGFYDASVGTPPNARPVLGLGVVCEADIPIKCSLGTVHNNLRLLSLIAALRRRATTPRNAFSTWSRFCPFPSPSPRQQGCSSTESWKESTKLTDPSLSLSSFPFP